MNTLPELSETWLDEPGLRQLFDELERDAAVREVRVKGAPARMASPEGVPLREAERRLLAGELRGVQVLYGFEGANWCDTILAHERAWRVCRMQIS